MEPITVFIPVGPYEHNRRWLLDALNSVRLQTSQPAELIVVDDCAGVKKMVVEWAERFEVDFPVMVYETLWNVGVVDAFNFAVSLAANECILNCGSDDMLEPFTVRACQDVYKGPGYYWCGVRYVNEDGSRHEKGDQWLPSGAAMVTKTMWRRHGGLAPELAVGNSDWCFIAMLNEHPELGPQIKVEAPSPTHLFRLHDNNDQTYRTDRGWGEVVWRARAAYMATWKPPVWGRMP